MRAKKARTEVRRDQIARAAMKLLAVRGSRQVSLAAIARQVGMVPSAVYRHFQGKQEVLDEVLNLVDHSFQANIQAARAAAADPLGQLHEALARHVKLIVRGVPIPRIILSDDVFAGSVRHRKRVQAIYRNYLAAVGGIIREGQKQGQIQRGLAGGTLALVWLGLVQSPAILWLLGRGDFNLKLHCEHAWALFVAAIQSKRALAAKEK